MSEFKSQEEVLRVLLDGKILIGNDFIYKIYSGAVSAKSIFGEDSWWPVLQNFVDYEKYSIYVEPKKKKTIVVAPAVYLCPSDEERFFLSEKLYSSVESAKEDLGNAFCAWLNVEMPIKVEVDDE